VAEYLIGTGGWAYFKVSKKPSLKAYSEFFDSVEVNNTFYEYPRAQMVERWRRIVPKDFTFTVRCHQDLTHQIGLKPVGQAYEVFSRMIRICRMLEAPFLHLLTPAYYVFNDDKISQAKDFFSSISLNGVRLAWEARCPITTKMTSLFRDLEIVHSVDLSRENLSGESDVIYTRLFGKGKHNIYQFTDDELKKIDRKVVDAAVRMAIITWHGVRMNTDAARFKIYKETGKFLPVTAYRGVDAAKAVLKEDAKFPSSKAELIENQGWKVIDLTADKRVHLSELLTKIPEKIYHDIKDVAKELEAFL